MKEIMPRIMIDPEILGGKPIIKGTRIPVDVIVGHVAAGDTIEKIVESFDVEKADVQAALAFASTLVSEQRIIAFP